ncbi:hypothetical protein IMG5_124130, partial [Ichthyophthirius multifiliis]
QQLKKKDKKCSQNVQNFFLFCILIIEQFFSDKKKIQGGGQLKKYIIENKDFIQKMLKMDSNQSYIIKKISICAQQDLKMLFLMKKYYQKPKKMTQYQIYIKSNIKTIKKQSKKIPQKTFKKTTQQYRVNQVLFLHFFYMKNQQKTKNKIMKKSKLQTVVQLREIKHYN